MVDVSERVGCWPLHIFIDIEDSQLRNLIEHSALLEENNRLSPCPSPLHCSLSRSELTLAKNQIKPLLKDLRDAVSKVAQNEPRKIYISAKQFLLLENESKDQLFVCFELFDLANSLPKLLQAINAVLGRYGKDTYYENPIIHTSLFEIAQTSDCETMLVDEEHRIREKLDMSDSMSDLKQELEFIELDRVPIIMKYGDNMVDLSA
ncbi:MAG: hypothetical protein MHMPM18_002673 [Marteilia pararefringens]